MRKILTDFCTDVKQEEAVRKMPKVPSVPSAKLVFAEPTYGIADIFWHGIAGQAFQVCAEIATVKSSRW